MDIEEVAASTPEKIHKVAIDPKSGLTHAQAEDIARKIGVPEPSVPEARKFMQGLYRAFDECDASLAEINPLILTGDGKVLALDAKLNFDSNALFRHPEIVAMRDLDEEAPAEVEASKFDLSYISLDGNPVDLLWRRGRDLFDVHAALGTRHQGDALGGTVDHHADVELLANVGALLDQQALDDPAFGAGLMGDEGHTKNPGGVFA